MRHFDFLDDAERSRLFHRFPEPLDARSAVAVLAIGLGATLYSPATRPRLADDIARRRREGVTSMVICLEDSIPDDALADAERNALDHLRRYADSADEAPALFVRVRSAGQIPMIVEGLGSAERVLAGFVLPKFTSESGPGYLAAVDAAGRQLGRTVWAMPVLESPDVAQLETRTAALGGIRALLEAHRACVLAVRIGATDLSGLYGLRRSREHTVWDIALLATLIGDVVNVLGRADDGWVVTGPVWEYFSGSERIFKPRLRATPFDTHHESRLRGELIARDFDGLIREVTLDRANGLDGKTVIHPSHVAVVHALSVVSHEEYLDALDIAGTARGGGVTSSTYRNKMNESKPHAAWARRTLLRAQVFGVAGEDVSFVDLLAASLHPSHQGA